MKIFLNCFVVIVLFCLNVNVVKADINPPTNLVVKVNLANPMNKLDIRWSAPTSVTGLKGYKIYRNGTLISTLAGMTKKTYTDTGLTTNTSFAYAVATYNTSGDISVKTPTVSAMTYPTYAQLPPLTGLVAADVSTSSVTIQWNNAVGVKYRIMRSGPDGFRQLSAVGIKSSNGISRYTDNNLFPDISYKYTVIGTDNDGNAPGIWGEEGVCCTTAMAIVSVVTLKGPAVESKYDFGGIYGTNPNFNNPATGSRTCPTGYTSSQILHYNGYSAFACLRKHVAGVDPFYYFGGMYGTKQASNVLSYLSYYDGCLAGFDSTKITSQLLPEYYQMSGHVTGYATVNTYMCITKSVPDNKIGLGGFYSTLFNNPATGGKSCPDQYTSTQGGYPDLSYCYRKLYSPTNTTTGPLSTKFKVNDRVKLITSGSVLASAPSVEGRFVVGAKVLGSLGTIKVSPSTTYTNPYNNNGWYWYVDFDGDSTILGAWGTDEGWVREDDLVLASVSPTPSVALQWSGPTSANIGSSLAYTLKWNANPTQIDQTIFVHFLDSSGNVKFSSSVNPSPRTTLWSGLVSTPVTTNIPAGTPAGTYKVMVGLYNGSTRLPLNSGSGVTADSQSRYQVGTVNVVAPTATTPLTANSCIVSNSSVKVGESVTWSVSAYGGKAPYTYNWSDVTNVLDPVRTSSVSRTYNTPGTKRMSYYVYDSAGSSTTSWVNCTPSVNVTADVVVPPVVAVIKPTISSISLIDASTDKVSINFNPGYGGRLLDPNSNDWHWRMTIDSGTINNSISSISIVNDYNGQAWSTSDNQYYPLVVFGSGGTKLNNQYGQRISLSVGTTVLDLYGQPELMEFEGATATVIFTDGTVLQTQISPSSIKQSAQIKNSSAIFGAGSLTATAVKGATDAAGSVFCFDVADFCK